MFLCGLSLQDKGRDSPRRTELGRVCVHPHRQTSTLPRQHVPPPSFYVTRQDHCSRNAAFSPDGRTGSYSSLAVHTALRYGVRVPSLDGHPDTDVHVPPVVDGYVSG